MITITVKLDFPQDQIEVLAAWLEARGYEVHNMEQVIQSTLESCLTTEGRVLAFTSMIMNELIVNKGLLEVLEEMEILTKEVTTA